MITSMCGLICTDCIAFPGECRGCLAVEGKPYWTSDVTPNGICPLYDCAVHQKEYHHCGDCPELPCQMFVGLKDPAISDAEHQKLLKKRVANLRKLEKGNNNQ